MSKRIKITIIMAISLSLLSALSGQKKYETDVIGTSKGPLKITFIGHASLMFEFNGKVIHVDPVMREGDYSQLPDADLILITHEHGDHFDPSALKQILTPKTKIVLSQRCYDQFQQGEVMKNGDQTTVLGYKIEAVPAYNIVHHRSNGEPFHPKGVGNGYVITFGNKRVYVAGDTENIPEMSQLKNIDIAFLPMNLPYTMTPEMTADAARSFRPKILYPYHYGKTDPQKLVDLLKNDPEIEVRIRQMQ